MLGISGPDRVIRSEVGVWSASGRRLGGEAGGEEEREKAWRMGVISTV